MIINEIGSDGEPKNPAKASTKATNFCGFLVRERVPISIQRWKSSRADDVSAAQKEMLWTEIKAKYTIKEEHEQLVRKWSMKKMARQVYTPHIERLDMHQILTSFQSTEIIGNSSLRIRLPKRARLIKEAVNNKDNASKKEYHHKLGPGGYKGFVDKSYLKIMIGPSVRSVGSIMPTVAVYVMMAR